MERPKFTIKTLVPIETVLSDIMASINTLDASRYRQVQLPGAEQPLVVIREFVQPQLSIIRTDSSSGVPPRSTVKKPSGIRWLRRFLVLIGILASVGGIGVVNSEPVQAAVVNYEYIVNKWEGDGSNSQIYASSTVFEIIPSGQYRFRNYQSFSIPRNWCAQVSYNHGPWRLRGPGIHYFQDGAHIQVDPHLC